MTHKHVVKVRYELVPSKVVFDDPPPVDWETEVFRMHLEDSIASFEMIKHHCEEHTARAQLDSVGRDAVVSI